MYQTEPSFLDWFFLKIYNLITGNWHVGGPGPGFKNTIIFILALVGIFFFAVVVYSVMRLKERRKIEHEEYHKKIHAAGKVHYDEKETGQWDKVLKHIKSDSPGDWRVAIIEADNILDDLTKELDLVGDDLGQRLRNASPHHFKNLENAWEAHKIRNKIAHEGLAYDLSYREAKRAIELYESVFREAEFI